MAGTNEIRAAAVLFENFETVFHSTPGVLADSNVDSGGWFAWEPFGYLRVGLKAVEKSAPAQVLANSQAILLGSKNFHPPIGLGRVQSTRCYVVILKKESTFDLARYFNKVKAGRAAGGAPVWYWSAELEEFGENDPRPSALFAAQMKQSYVLVCNDLEELLNVSGYLASANDDARILAGIHDWNDLSQREFWGYRKYKHGESRMIDRLTFRITGQITPKAEAVAVYLDLKKQTGVLRLFSSSPDDATASNINATKGIPPLKPVSPGAWETVFPLDDSANFVLWLFGWGVLV